MRTARIAVLLGALGSIGFLIRASQTTPRVLLGIMLLWVVAPFAGVAIADVVSKRWPDVLRRILSIVMLVLALGSLAVYAEDAWRPRQAQAAFVFVAVPLVSWVLMAIVAPIAMLVSRRRS